MFTGEYNHTIDAKSRIIVPSKLREGLGEQFVITRGLEGCIFMFTISEWENFAASLKDLPGTMKARKVQRAFFAAATYCETDKQGRVLIPANLKEYGGLEKDVVFVGVDTRVEIWSKDRWMEVNDYSDIDELVEDLSEFGLKF